MILQTGGMGQVLEHVLSKLEALILKPSIPKGKKRFSVSSLTSFQYTFFLGSLFLTTFSFFPKTHCNYFSTSAHVI
jgi:hypothetical protein